jgi:SAM-dependent methyltransferase
MDPGPSSEPQTWHYGVVARWWAEFNQDGPEIAYFQRFIEDDGQPALDVACGTGRLLVPWLRAGLDVDGSDISPDMLALCRERAEREGLTPTLFAQPTHRLDLPRRYRTIVVCGGFGLAGDRELDEAALARLFAHLEPGGTLAMDNEVPYADSRLWRAWTKEGHDELPEAWPEPRGRRRASDGTDLELRARVVALDPLAQRVTMEMRGRRWRGEELIEEDVHTLHMSQYLTHELRMMLERAGFVDVELRAGYTDEPPTADTEFVVFIARKPDT